MMHVGWLHKISGVGLCKFGLEGCLCSVFLSIPWTFFWSLRYTPISAGGWRVVLLIVFFDTIFFYPWDDDEFYFWSLIIFFWSLTRCNSYEFTTIHQFLEIGVRIYLLYMRLLTTVAYIRWASKHNHAKLSKTDHINQGEASELPKSCAGSFRLDQEPDLWAWFDPLLNGYSRYGRMMMNDGYGRMIMNGLQILRTFLFANNLFLQVWKSFWAWTFSNVTSWDYPQSLVSSIPLEVSLFAELALTVAEARFASQTCRCVSVFQLGRLAGFARRQVKTPDGWQIVTLARKPFSDTASQPEILHTAWM